MLRLISISDGGPFGTMRWYSHPTLGEVSTRTRREGTCVLIDLDYARRRVEPASPRLRPPYGNTCPAEPNKPARKPRAKRRQA